MVLTPQFPRSLDNRSTFPSNKLETYMTTQMKASFLKKQGEIAVETIDVPEVRSDEVLVQVVAV